MTIIASRDLRNHTAEVLRKVAEGDHVTITVQGRPVAELTPVMSRKRSSFTVSELVDVIDNYQADPGLTRDLARLSGDTTDDLGDLT